MNFKSGFLNEINERGFIYQHIEIEELDKLMSKNKISGYIGFDITSDSLHVGSLIQLMLLHWLDFYGHQSIALVGGGTTLIGDPSGKDKTRKILSKNQIDKNINNIERTFSRFINLQNNSLIINNYDWLSNLNYIDFLREFGSKITLNKMLTFESIKGRLDREQPLTILEFNYMLLQAYDFYYLNKNYNCILQMGGSDQWGNILSGVDLIRKINKKDAFGITSPLITGTEDPPGITAFIFFPFLIPPDISNRSEKGVPRGISKFPGLLMWPETEKHLKPALSEVPNFLNQDSPSKIILGKDAKVSTLLIIVGWLYKPLIAGNGGLYLGNPFFPSNDSSIAVSSPQIYAPAPIKSYISIEICELKIFLPT